MALVSFNLLWFGLYVEIVFPVSVILNTSGYWVMPPVSKTSAPHPLSLLSFLYFSNPPLASIHPSSSTPSLSWPLLSSHSLSSLPSLSNWFPFMSPPTLSFPSISSVPCFLLLPPTPPYTHNSTMIGWLIAAGGLFRAVGPLFANTINDNFGAQVLFADLLGYDVLRQLQQICRCRWKSVTQVYAIHQYMKHKVSFL